MRNPKSPKKIPRIRKPASRRQVWLLMVDGKNTKDLAKLDSDGSDVWKGNRLIKAGDLIVMYRTAPFSDFAYVFVARNKARKVKKWYWPYQVKISGGYRLSRTVKHRELRRHPVLKHWDFAKNARGFTQRLTDLEATGVWTDLSRLLVASSPGIDRHFGSQWTGGKRRPVFLSYSSDDKRRAEEICVALKLEGLDVWLDQLELHSATDWDEHINSAIASARAFVVCISKTWKSKRHRYAQREFKTALRVAERRERFLHPILIENCEMPDELKSRHAKRVFGREKQRNLEQLALELSASR
jgi:hypothetical protein